MTEAVPWRSSIAWLDRSLDQATDAVCAASPPGPAPTARPVDIIVLIFEAFEQLEVCLATLASCTPGKHRIWLMDDASQDKRIGKLAERWAAADPRFRYVRQARNLGYVGNVNDALARTDRDVVLLNSDTGLTTGWLNRLVRAIDKNPAIGSISPLSNQASLLSITRPDSTADSNEMAQLVATTAETTSIPIPTAVGFCMLIRRQLIDEIGCFDSAFGRGYGEEVDFCLRAYAAGWQIHACTDAYVHHEGEASFGQLEHTHWRTANDRLLASRWPSYEALTRTWWRDNPLRAQAERIAALQRKRPLIVHLLHRWHTAGGTELLTSRLISQLSDEFSHLVIVPGSGSGIWADAAPRRVAPGIELLIWNHDYLKPDWRLMGHPAGLGDPWLDRWLAQVLAASGASLVHVHHLLGWNTLNPPLIARALGLPTLLSLHCFHYLCADYNQIGAEGQPCGKRLAMSDADCTYCLQQRITHPRGVSSEAVADYIANRRILTRQVVQNCDHMVAPSDFLIERMTRAYGPGVGAKIEKLPHSVEAAPSPEPRRRDGRLVVIYLGGLKRLKGSHTLITAASLLVGQANIEIRLYGPDGDQRSELETLPANCTWLGQYEHKELPGIVADADILVVPSIVEESFSLVLSEAWTHGRPVIASRCGAMAERVQHGRNGWLFEPGDADALADQLRELATPKGRQQLHNMSQHLCEEAEHPVDECAQAYREIYRRLGVPKKRPATGARKPSLLQAWAALQENHLRSDQLHQDEALASSGNTFRVRTINPTGQVERAVKTLDLSAAGSPALNIEDLATLQAEWLLLLSPDEHLLPEMLSSLAVNLQGLDHVNLLQTDHIHRGPGGHLHGRVLKPACWDHWLAMTTTELDHGWVVRTKWLVETLRNSQPLKSVDLKRWLRETAATEKVVMLNLPVMAVDDQAPLLERNLAAVFSGSTVQAAELPPIIVLDSGSRDHLLYSLNALNRQEAEVSSVIVRSGRKPPPGRWPTHWHWIELDAPDPLPGQLRLILRAGILPVDLAGIRRHLVCFEDPDLAAIGFAFADFSGGQIGAACAMLAGGGRRRRHPPWPNGVRDDQPVLRLSGRLSGDISLVHTRLPGRCGLERALLNGAPLVCKGRYQPLLASSLLAARGMDHPPRLELDNGPIPDPVASPLLALGGPEWRVDPLAAQKSLTTSQAPQAVVITPDAWASSQYRVRLPLAALSEQSRLAPPVIVDLSQHQLPSQAGWQRLAPDVVLLHNVFEPAVLNQLKQLKPRPRLLILLDDLLTELPDYNPFRHTRRSDLVQRLNDHMSAADLLVVSTEALAMALAPLPCPVRVIENALPAEPWQSLHSSRASNPGQRLRVGWAGAQQHEGDLRLIKSLVRSTSTLVDWILFGMCPDYLRPWVAEYHPAVAFEDYPAHLAELKLDLAVAPLLDNAFNRCKSALKLLEYGSLGIPVIASDLPPYQHAPVLRVDGTAKQWRAALDHYLDHPERRRTDGETLRQWVLHHCDLGSRLTDWDSAINPITTKTGSNIHQ